MGGRLSPRRARPGGKTLQAVWGSGGGGERAVANYDEDSLTMAVEASLDALAGRDVSTVGACFLASTTAPYLEKSSATLLATATDLGREVLTADLGGSLRCGTTALRLALHMGRAGSASPGAGGGARTRPPAHWIPPGLGALGAEAGSAGYRPPPRRCRSSESPVNPESSGGGRRAG